MTSLTSLALHSPFQEPLVLLLRGAMKKHVTSYGKTPNLISQYLILHIKSRFRKRLGSAEVTDKTFISELHALVFTVGIMYIIYSYDIHVVINSL